MVENHKVIVTALDVFQVETAKSRPVNVQARPFYAISYRNHGEITIKTNETSLHSKAGQITFVPKGVDYQTEVLSDTALIAMHFDVLDDAYFTEAMVFDDPNGQLRPLIQQIFSLYDLSGKFHCECLSAFYTLLSLINDAAMHKQLASVNPKLQQAKLLLDNHFTDPQYSIASLTAALQLSDSYLRREFKKQYGVCPIGYLKRLRIKHAKLMLTADYYSIEQVAKQCGFNSTSYFIQTFHKEAGLSPAKYKALALLKK